MLWQKGLLKLERWGKERLLNMRNFVESSQPSGPKAQALIFNFSCFDCSYSYGLFCLFVLFLLLFYCADQCLTFA